MLLRLTLAAHTFYAQAAPTPGPKAPDPAPSAPPGLGQKVDTILSWLKWGGGAAGVCGLLICGLMMLLGRRNRHSMSADGAVGIPWVLAGLSLVATAPAIVSAFL
jgi:hypothetical protein